MSKKYGTICSDFDHILMYIDLNIYIFVQNVQILYRILIAFVMFVNFTIHYMF